MAPQIELYADFNYDIETEQRTYFVVAKVNVSFVPYEDSLEAEGATADEAVTNLLRKMEEEANR